MTRIFLLLSLLLSMPIVVAEPIRTQICIRNKTDVQHRITAGLDDDWQWPNENNPEHNFRVTIEPNQTICRAADFSENAANVNFAFYIDYRRVDMVNAPTVKKDDKYSDYRWFAKQEYFYRDDFVMPKILHGEKNIWFLSPYWWVGYACEGTLCDLFEIRPPEKSN